MAPDIELGSREAVICYKDEDRERVNEIRKVLESQEVSVFQAKTGPNDGDVHGGDYWPEIVVPALRACKVVLLMCTNLSLNSPEVQSEVTLSRTYKKRLIPLHLEKNLVIPDAMAIALACPNHIDVFDRPPDDWLPALLTALGQFGVSFRHLPLPLPPLELRTTVTWLDQLRNAVGGLREYAFQASDSREEESLLNQRTAAAVEYLITIDKQLPRLQRTLVAVAQHKQVPAVEVTALFQLQNALIDVARLVMRLRRESPEGLGELSMPPYDVWLPFKDGLGKSSQHSTPI